MLALLGYSSLSSEASMRYFVLSASVSCLVLLGISIIYLNYATIDLNILFSMIPSFGEDFPPLLLSAFFLIVSGIIFKLGIIPFHYWIADVYQGSFLSTTAIFAIIAKIPVFVLLTKFNILLSVSINYQIFLFVIGLSSVVVGLVSAMYEVNFKRFLAYGAISHMGYVVVILSLNVSLGVVMAYNYLIIYIFNTIILFTIVSFFVKHQEGKQSTLFISTVQDISIIYNTNPFLAYILGAVLLSLAGIPPFSGFFAKYFIFQLMVETNN
eukprot:TRINITY_DN3725_c0_g1_i1.p1 TRINITY_DN3725_c0_g1~~TRINITY_DN3725_c0_g1_i1.p1  ORF type:complete len:276 (+),score=-9.52 TRINITY_DN3725_c0_g1_i1:26-829(+)